MRTLNRLVLLVLGVASVAVGVITLVEIVLARTDSGAWVIPRSRWDATLADARWSDNGVEMAGIGLLAVGALLVVTQLLPRRPLEFPVHDPRPGRRTVLERRSFESLLTRAVLEDRDVSAARVQVKGRRTKVQATAAHGADLAAIRARLPRALEAESTALGVQGQREYAVDVLPTGARVR
ncbi:hypothetical protein BH18ACT4_BH18ACT4_12390 [soil metagenome]